MHEIITLQLGQRSNYLATHFWNTQVALALSSPWFYCWFSKWLTVPPGILLYLRRFRL